EGETLREGALAFAFDTANEHGDTNSGDCAHPELLAALQSLGAVFLTRLSAVLDEAPSVLLQKLMDLVWEGRVAGDQFAPIRNQLLAGGKLHPKLGSGFGRWYAIEPPVRGAELDEMRALAWAKHLLRAFGGVTGQL